MAISEETEEEWDDVDRESEGEKEACYMLMLCASVPSRIGLSLRH